MKNKFLLLIILFFVGLLVFKFTPQTKTTNLAVAPSIIHSKLPIFDSTSGACKNITNVLSFKNADGMDIIWQTSIPRRINTRTFLNDNVQIGLRNKNGTQKDNFSYVVSVLNPDSVEEIAYGATNADNWSYLIYPKDFSGGSTNKSGAYTVLFWIKGKLMTCDGFIIE